MNWRLVPARLVGAALLALLCALLVAGSSLLALLPAEPPYLAVALVALALLSPSLFARASPMPMQLAVLVPVLGVATYEQSRLDWMRLLKDFGLTDTAFPSVARLGLALAAFALVWATHAVDHAARVRARSTERGIEPRDARAAAAHVLRESARRGGLALAGTLGLAAFGLLLVAATPLAETLGGRSSLVAPLAGAALVAVAAYLLAKRG